MNVGCTGRSPCTCRMDHAWHEQLLNTARRWHALACTRLARAACMTTVPVGWSQEPASCSAIIILLMVLCTCTHASC